MENIEVSISQKQVRYTERQRPLKLLISKCCNEIEKRKSKERKLASLVGGEVWKYFVLPLLFYRSTIVAAVQSAGISIFETNHVIESLFFPLFDFLHALLRRSEALEVAAVEVSLVEKSNDSMKPAALPFQVQQLSVVVAVAPLRSLNLGGPFLLRR